MRKREQIMLERIQYVGKTDGGISLCFCDRALNGPRNTFTSRYIVSPTEEGPRGLSFNRKKLFSVRHMKLPKQFVAILQMIAFPEVI